MFFFPPIFQIHFLIHISRIYRYVDEVKILISKIEFACKFSYLGWYVKAGGATGFVEWKYSKILAC